MTYQHTEKSSDVWDKLKSFRTFKGKENWVRKNMKGIENPAAFVASQEIKNTGKTPQEHHAEKNSRVQKGWGLKERGKYSRLRVEEDLSGPEKVSMDPIQLLFFKASESCGGSESRDGRKDSADETDDQEKSSEISQLFLKASQNIRDASLVGYGDPSGFRDVYVEETAPAGGDRLRRAALLGLAGATAGLTAGGAVRGVDALANRLGAKVPGFLAGRSLPAKAIAAGAAAGGGLGALLGGLSNRRVREAYDPSTGAELPERIERQASSIANILEPGYSPEAYAVGMGADLSRARGFGRRGTPDAAYAVDLDEMARVNPEAVSSFLGG